MGMEPFWLRFKLVSGLVENYPSMHINFFLKMHAFAIFLTQNSAPIHPQVC